MGFESGLFWKGYFDVTLCVASICVRSNRVCLVLGVFLIFMFHPQRQGGD